MFIVPKVIKDYIGTIFFGKLCSPIDFRGEDISIRASADEQGSISPHEGEGEALVELPGGNSWSLGKLTLRSGNFSHFFPFFLKGKRPYVGGWM